MATKTITVTTNYVVLSRSIVDYTRGGAPEYGPDRIIAVYGTPEEANAYVAGRGKAGKDMRVVEVVNP